MEELPELETGFTRLAVLLEKPDGVTPGAIARRLGIDLEQLGPVLVMDGQVVVDVANDYVNRARANLEELGPIQEIGRKEVPVTWEWLKIAVGRNHGLTLAHLRKVMDRAESGPLGRLHVNNTHSTIGLRGDLIAGVIERLADTKINGIAAKPEHIPASKMHESAAYKRPPR